MGVWGTNSSHGRYMEKKQIITAVELENIHFAAYISQLMYSKQKTKQNKTKINPLNFFFQEVGLIESFASCAWRRPK